MEKNFKLSKEDIDIESQDALDLFYAGIKAEQTRTTMYRLLKKFLLEACENILHGTYRQRAEEFVILAKQDCYLTTTLFDFSVIKIR